MSRRRSTGQRITIRPAAARVLAAVAVVLALGAGLSVAATASSAVDGAGGSTLKVGIKPLDPFVTRTGATYGGFSIDLWNEIARRNSWTTTYVWNDTLKPMLDDVQAGKDDVGIAGISITKDREQVIDFSYPMFNSGLEVMVSNQTSGLDLTGAFGSFITAGVGRYLMALVAVLVIAGHVIWLVTRRRTHLSYLPGVGLGIYKAAGMGLSGDYGVADPARPLARFAAVIWSIVGICFVALFTATVTTQLTMQSIQGSIRGVHDLGGATVVTVDGTSAAAYLKNHALTFTAVASIDEAYRKLDAGTADAVVFDAPVLEHRVQVTSGSNELVVGGIFAHEDYGIAFPTGSGLRKKVNTTLLEMRSDGTFDQLYAKYFGATTG